MDKEHKDNAVHWQPIIMSCFVAKWQRIREMNGSVKPSTIFSTPEPSLEFNKSIILSDISLVLKLTLLPVYISFT